MIKIKTLFKKDPSNLGRVINEINPINSWVYECGVPTRKFDGTPALIKDGKIYKRLDLKEGRDLPLGAIPCEPARDENTGHWPHWVECDKNNPADKFFWEAFTGTEQNGTYELCGPKINGNKEHLTKNMLIPHGKEILDIKDFSFEAIKEYLSNSALDIEGIVFHANDGSGRMAKIRKTDFGIKR